MQADWRRASPIASVDFLFKNLRSAVNLWPAFAGALAVEELRSYVFVLGVPALLGFLAVLSGLQWWFFRYQYDDRQIQLRSGVLNRKRLTLDFDRVQEVNLEQALHFRLFALWSLDLESAGSKTKEVQIPGISHRLANDIRERFLAYKQYSQKDTSSNTDAEAPPKPPDYKLQLGIAELVRFGLMHNTLIYIVPVLGGIISQSGELMRWVGDWLEQLPLIDWLSVFIQTQGTTAALVLGSIVFLVLLVAIYLLSILLAVMKYWRYELRVEGERFQYTAGLVHRVNRGFKLHKLQCVTVQQGMVARLLKRYSLTLQQTNAPAGDKQGGVSGFFIPVLTQEALAEIQAMIAVHTGDWQRTKPAWVAWDALIFGSLIAGSAAWAAWYFDTLTPWLGLTAFPLIALFCWGKWRKSRYYLGNGWVAVQSGLIGTKTTYIPAEKVQKLQLKTGPVLRIHRSATLKIWSGSKAVSVEFADRNSLTSIRDNLLQHVGNHQGRWM